MWNNNNNKHDTIPGPSMPTNYTLPRGTVNLESQCLNTLISKRQVHEEKRLLAKQACGSTDYQAICNS